MAETAAELSSISSGADANPKQKFGDEPLRTSPQQRVFGGPASSFGEVLRSVVSLVPLPSLRRDAARGPPEASQVLSEEANRRRLRSSALLVFAVAASGVWGFFSLRKINRLLERRYADIAFQIRRPDSLRSRASAFKTLVGGGLLLPVSAVAVFFAATPALTTRDEEADAAATPSTEFQGGVHSLLSRKAALSLRRAVGSSAFNAASSKKASDGRGLSL